MRITPPSEWGAQVDYDSWDDPFSPDDGIALHHGGGSDYAAAQPPYTFEKSAALLRSWERYHLNKGWRGLAYGYGVDQAGHIFRIRGLNRYGAHLGDVDGDGVANNDEIVPIIWIASGNHHQVSPAADLAIQYLRRHVIEAASPKATILWGHKEIQSKLTACPGPGGMAYVNTHRYLPEQEENMQLPEERRADVEALIGQGVIQADIRYYFPSLNGPSADLPVEEWVNLTLAAIGGASRMGLLNPPGGQRSASDIRRIIADAINNG